MTINLTDSANHPANGPLTAERIERVIEALQRSIQYQNGGDMAYVIADAIKGLEELLVSKEAASKPVGNDELDHLIWGFQREGFHARTLAALVELRGVRKAKGEPVAWDYEWAACITCEGPQDFKRVIEREAPPQWAIDEGQARNIIPLYATAESVPEPVTNRDELPNAIFKPVADLYGITSPTGSETTFTFDAAEASGFVGSGWSVQEYVELERYQAAVAANFRETVNSSTRNFRGNEETSTNCPKCGGRGTYHCPQMPGTVECECTFPAALRREVSGRIQEGRAQIREEMVMGSRLTRHRFKP